VVVTGDCLVVKSSKVGGDDARCVTHDQAHNLNIAAGHHHLLLG
jgi:hypothetical protein